MAKMKAPIVILVLIAVSFLPAGEAHALGGMTGDKITVPHPFALEEDHVEMEMAFSLFRSTALFNGYGHLKDLPADYDKRDPFSDEDPVFSENGVSFRVSGGVYQDLELTLAYGHLTTERVPDRLSFTHFDDVEALLKYYLGEKGPVSAAIQGGVYYETSAWTPDYHLGGILSYRPSALEGFSIDLEFWGSRSAIRTINETRTNETGYGTVLGIGYRLGKLTPSIEIRHDNSYYDHYRLYRAGRVAEINLNLSPEEARIDLLPILAERSGYTLPTGWQDLRDRYHFLKEKVTFRERSVVVHAGFNYDWNENASVLLSYSEEVEGVNTYAGKTISLAFSWLIQPSSQKSKDSSD